MAGFTDAVTLIIPVVLTSIAILFFATLFEKLLIKIKLYILKRRIDKAAHYENINNLTDGLVRLSISKLRSKDAEKKKLGLNELQYGWVKYKGAKKQLIIDELIDILSKESDPRVRDEIILILYKLIKSNL